MPVFVHETHNIILCARNTQRHFLCRRHAVSISVQEEAHNASFSAGSTQYNSLYGRHNVSFCGGDTQCHNVSLCKGDAQRRSLCRKQTMSFFVRESRNVSLCAGDTQCHNVSLCEGDAQCHSVSLCSKDTRCRSLQKKHTMPFYPRKTHNVSLCA